ncbi:hypothetical protein AMJ87_06215 [candidate division WOR_3 bacterium SM23_60]|uniref:Orc1-like AAA ATPase domain-containing protein n=1 Tax=candidate division WOR_3 bacterium SM23_60 TaxID=1703780 RepID=A0A0S8GG90_UNCW3|nr:MAG: hypothetical protein AMJ87_06215 [candidate division WOR_3 bacterium SM23_60]
MQKKKRDDIVAHPIFGEGFILGTRYDGAEVQVQFRSGLCLWLPAKWLKLITAPKARLDQISSKRLLEAFRLGVVPHQDIEQFTFGRAYEINEMEQKLNALKKGNGDVYLIEGAYGSGKTHLLEYAHHMSLKKGFVTAYCELSTQETPLHRPKRVYRELMYNLRYIKDNSEFHYRDLLRMSARVDIADHCFFTPVLKRLQQGDNEELMREVFWQWIEGESTKKYATDPIAPFRVRGGQKIPALYDFSTATDFYTYILTGLSYLIDKLDLGGLVIILDEVETVTRIWDYGAYTRGLNFLEGLILSAYDSEELKKVDTRLIHNRVRPTPYIYKEPHILLILSMTPVHGFRGIEHIKSLIRDKSFLRTFNKTELEVIYDNLIHVYECAYPGFQVELSRRENIFNAASHRGSGELREFIKFSVEAFDWLRLGLQSPLKTHRDR